MSEPLQRPVVHEGRLAQSVCMVIYVYNEADLLDAAVRRCIAALEKDFEDYELLLIDDGSRDETAAEMARLADEFPRIRFERNYINVNIGINILRGFLMADKEYVLYNGIDLPLAPEDLKGLVARMAAEKADVLLCDRITHEGYTPLRYVMSMANRFLLKLFFRNPWRDLNFVQIFRTEHIPNLRTQSRSPGFVAPEMVFRAKALGLKIISVPVEYRARPVRAGGSLGSYHQIFWATYDLFRFWWTQWGGLKRSARK